MSVSLSLPLTVCVHALSIIIKQNDMIARNTIETEAGTLYKVRQIFKLLNDLYAKRFEFEI